MFKKYSKIAKLLKQQKRLIKRREELIKLEESIPYLIATSRSEEEKQSFEVILRNIQDAQYLYTTAIVDIKVDIEEIIAS